MHFGRRRRECKHSTFCRKNFSRIEGLYISAHVSHFIYIGILNFSKTACLYTSSCGAKLHISMNRVSFVNILCLLAVERVALDAVKIPELGDGTV